MRNDFISEFQHVIDTKIDAIWTNKNIDRSLRILQKQKDICDTNNIGWRPSGRSAKNQLITSDHIKHEKKKQSLEDAIEKEMHEIKMLMQELDESRRTVHAIESHRNELWSNINVILNEYDKTFDVACINKLNASLPHLK